MRWSVEILHSTVVTCEQQTNSHQNFYTFRHHSCSVWHRYDHSKVGNPVIFKCTAFYAPFQQQTLSTLSALKEPHNHHKSVLCIFSPRLAPTQFINLNHFPGMEFLPAWWCHTSALAGWHAWRGYQIRHNPEHIGKEHAMQVGHGTNSEHSLGSRRKVGGSGLAWDRGNPTLYQPHGNVQHPI